MESGILAEIPEFELTYNYSWDNFTTIYDKFGYYMFLRKENDRHAASGRYA